ncbi:MAG: sulfotransferase family 2 domain-containing protein [Campylobacterota bacterium]|nr:sulfotransferase family 2 domain-containing protein [Campylobacterota bacterium]
MNTNQHLLFIHIPKTAGTSFRLAAKDFYGEENIFFDYSPDSVETSSEILDSIYIKKDPYELYRELTKKPLSFLSGHFPEKKYMMFYEATNIISFVRDPVKQVVSHYNHHIKYLDYKKEFYDFINDARFQNIQSRLLSRRNIGMYGFLGVTDQYDKSIEIFNAVYQANLLSIYENRSDNSTVNAEEIDKNIIDLIYRFNEEDIKFYKSVCHQFEVRKKLYEQNRPFTHGMIQKRNKTAIMGCAFQLNSDSPVSIDIYHHDKRLTTLKANLYKPGLMSQGIPKKGFIGFHYRWSDDKIDNQDIHCIVKETGQEIL